MFRAFKGIDIRAHLLKENPIGIGSYDKHVFKFESTSYLSFQNIGNAGAFCFSGIFLFRFFRIDRFFRSASERQNRCERNCSETVNQ